MFIRKSQPNKNNTVKHSACDYVKEQASTNSVESFWALLKRGYYGTHYWWSFKHLHRYVSEYVYRHNTRNIIGLPPLGAMIRFWRARQALDIRKTD